MAQTVDTSMYNTKPAEGVNPLAILGQVTDISNAMQQNKLLQTQNVAGQIGVEGARAEVALKRYDNLQRMLAPLANNPNLTQKDMLRNLSDAVQNGLITPQEAAVESASWGEDHPDANRAIAQDHMVRFQSAADQIKALYGTPTQLDSGGNIIAGNVQSPMQGGGFIPATAIQKGLTPDSAAQRIPVYNPQTGQMGTVPLGSMGAAMPNNAIANAGNPSSGAVNPLSAPVPNAAPENATGSGWLPSAAPLGAAAAAEKEATGSVDALNQLRNSVAGSAPRLFQLQKALGGLEKGDTGPGSETVNEIRSFLVAQGPEVLQKLGIVDPEKVANYDEAKKYLVQYASGAASSMGAGTNEKLATALSGNASTKISNLAAQQVVKASIGLERMQQAQAEVFDQTGLPPQDYNKWQTKWNKEVDPRVFTMDLLTPKESAEMIKGMKKEEKAKFVSQLRMAVQAGYVTPPGQASAPQPSAVAPGVTYGD